MGYATYVSKVLRDSPLRANLDNKTLRVHESAPGDAYPAYIEVPRRPDVDTQAVLTGAVTFLRQNNFPTRQSQRPGIVMVGVQMKSATPAGTSTVAVPRVPRAVEEAAWKITDRATELYSDAALSRVRELLREDDPDPFALRAAQDALVKLGNAAGAVNQEVYGRLREAFPATSPSYFVKKGSEAFRPETKSDSNALFLLLTHEQGTRELMNQTKVWMERAGIRAKSILEDMEKSTVPLSTERRASLDKALEEGRITVRGHRKLSGKTESVSTPPKPNTHVSRDEAITAIRTPLKQRSSKAWSVRGGTGTAYGWITITAPPKRMDNYLMSREDAKELHQLLGLDFRPGPETRIQHITVPASSDYYREYVDRAAGRTPSINGKPYWD